MKEACYEWDVDKKELKSVKPKFKVGDWIITPENKVLQITSIGDTTYGFISYICSRFKKKGFLRRKVF